MRDFLLAFMKWERNQEKSLAIIFREELKKTGVYKPDFDMRALIGEIEWYYKTSMAVQSFVCFNELVKDGNFDATLKKGKYDFKTLKAKIDVDGIEKTTNSQQLIAIIRQAFAHNDDNEIANWYSEEDYLVIQSKKDKKRNKHNIKVDANLLVKILLMYMENVKYENYDAIALDIHKEKLKRSLKENTLTPAQVGNIFKQMFTISKEKEMDKFQKQALFNCLTNVEMFKEDDFEHITNEFLLMLFPLKENAYVNGCDIMDTMAFLNSVHDNYTSFNKYLKAIAELFLGARDEYNLPKHYESMLYFMFGESNKIVAVMANNLLFYMFSFESVENLKKCFRSDLNIKRIRNSLMHGRHFYNYSGAYEFYDGIKEMEHIGSISCKEILEAINILVENYMKERDNKF